MGTDGDAGRRRMLGLAGLGVLALALVAGGALILRDDGPTTPLPDGSAEAVAREPVPTESIAVANRQFDAAHAVVRHEDQILIVDGTATTNGLDPWDPDADPITRVWVVDADAPEQARPFDLPSVGPIVRPQVWWWDGQWAIGGQPCPEPIDPAELEARGDPEPRSCGLDTIGLFRFDPDTGVVEDVATLDYESWGPGGELYLEVVATNGRHTLIDRMPGDLVSIDVDGAITALDEVPGTDVMNAAAPVVVPDGDSFLALSPTVARLDNGELRYDEDELRPAESFWQRYRLEGTEWQPGELPSAGHERISTDGAQPLDRDIATFGRHQLGSSINEPWRANSEILVLRLDERSAASWEIVALDALPDEFDASDPQVIDGQLLVGPELGRRWDGETWVPAPPQPEGSHRYVFIEDLTGTLAFRAGEDPSDPMKVVITSAD